MDISADYDYLGSVNLLGSQRTTTDSALKAVTKAAETAKTADKDSQTAAFAQALKEELENLQRSGGLENALAGASTFGVTANAYDISEMMKTESGRKAINAMADNAMMSIVFGNGDSNDKDSVLNTLTRSNLSSEQRLEDALKDILEVLGTSSGSEQTN